MYARRMHNYLLTGLLVTVFTASLATGVHASEYALGAPQVSIPSSQKVWDGERIRQASQNWSDPVEERASADFSEHLWAGESIRQASLNWANYGQQSAVAVTSPRFEAGEMIRQASMNWADYAEDHAVAAASR